MRRPVAEEPEVAAEKSRVLLEDLSEMIRSGLFFTLEKEFQIHRGTAPRRFECVQRCQHADNRSLVIAGTACVEPGFGVNTLASFRKRDVFLFKAQDRHPGIAVPLGGHDRLAVEVRVEEDGASRAWSGE